MADQINQMNKLLDPSSTFREGEMPSQMDAARASGEIVADPNSAVREGELQMIINAQMGLMEMDPSGTKDIVDGLEVTKKKVMAGGKLTEGESSGIMAILQKLGGALSGLMSGDGETNTYMIDGNPVEMNERERMSAINAGMLVQDMGTYQVDDRMERMTPDTYADRVARGEITPDGSTEAEKAIRANEEFNRRIQEEQERVFRMNNPQVTQ